MYQYEVLRAAGFLPENLYGIICKEKQGERWAFVSVSLPFSNNRREAEQIAKLCTAKQLPPEKVMQMLESIREASQK